MKILTVGLDPGDQGLKLRDEKNTNRFNLGMKKLYTAFLYTCAIWRCATGGLVSVSRLQGRKKGGNVCEIFKLEIVHGLVRNCSLFGEATYFFCINKC